METKGHVDKIGFNKKYLALLLCIRLPGKTETSSDWVAEILPTYVPLRMSHLCQCPICELAQAKDWGRMSVSQVKSFSDNLSSSSSLHLVSFSSRQHVLLALRRQKYGLGSQSQIFCTDAGSGRGLEMSLSWYFFCVVFSAFRSS